MSKSLLHHLEHDREVYALLKHPFYQLWNQGKVSKEALKDYAKQYYHFTEHFPRFVAGVYKNCKDVQLRKKILRNLVEEELGDYEHENPHAEQWMGFCNALGLSREDVLHAALFPETEQLLHHFEQLTDETFESGLGCVLAYEAQVSAVAESKKAGLVTYYHISSQKGLEFFNTHSVIDIEHSKVWSTIIADVVVTDKQHALVESAHHQSLQAQLVFLDGIMKATGLRSC